MSLDVDHILQHALDLPALERATLAEALLSSLDRPDPRIDEIWSKEAEDRLADFEAGRMKSITAEDVFEELESN
jgi:putative addiction module component (TIGR02574 family)